MREEKKGDHHGIVQTSPSASYFVHCQSWRAQASAHTSKRYTFMQGVDDMLAGDTETSEPGSDGLNVDGGDDRDDQEQVGMIADNERVQQIP